MRTIGKFTILVASGAIVGAGLGMLLAPQSGAETRRVIRHHARQAQIEASRLARRVKQGVERVKTVVAQAAPDSKAA